MLSRTRVLPTNNTPEIILNPEGRIFIKGRSSISDVKELPLEINEWLDAYLSNPAEITYLDICLEYIGGLNSGYFISLVKKISSVLSRDKKLKINWYYEEGDEDILEKGESYSTFLRYPFNFIMLKDATLKD